MQHVRASPAWQSFSPSSRAVTVEQAYHAALPVFEMMGASDRLSIHWRPGQHHGFEDPQCFFDWFDYALGRNEQVCA